MRNEEQPAVEGEREQFVIFKLDGTEFGVRIGQVRRIVRVTDFTRVPRAPAFLEGVINLEGEIVPVVALKKRFDLAPEPAPYGDKARIIVVEIGEEQVAGMVVDTVTEILWLPTASIEPPPAMVADVNGVYLSGVSHFDDRLIIILDLSRVLTATEVEAMATIGEG